MMISPDGFAIHHFRYIMSRGNTMGIKSLFAGFGELHAIRYAGDAATPFFAAITE